MRPIDADALDFGGCRGGGVGGMVFVNLSDIADAIKAAPTIDPIQAAGRCRCGECRFEEDCEKQVTIVRRDHVLEQNVYEHRRVEWCGAGEPREAQDDG